VGAEVAVGRNLGGAEEVTVDDVARNREAWSGISDDYQREHDAQLGVEEVVWGNWSISEAELEAIGDVAGKDVLELGCGAARFSIKLAKRGARPVGLDVSPRQLEHARQLMSEAGIEFPLVEASATDVPLADGSFDLVFCDHGGMTWADPYLTVREVARLLRSEGLLVFNMTSPFVTVCTDPNAGAAERLVRDYFGMHREESEWGAVEFQLPYGEWIRLLRANGFEVEALIELRPPDGATTTYGDWVSLEWAHRWPAENIWKARKRG
jgi:ubiquinone/menaquinone biosynthesis C-methylase UbiE